MLDDQRRVPGRLLVAVDLPLRLARRRVEQRRVPVPGVGIANSWNYSNSYCFYTLSGWNPVSSQLWGSQAVNATNLHEIYSGHTGGANVVFGDGSVRFLTTSTSIEVVASLITRAAGDSATLP